MSNWFIDGDVINVGDKHIDYLYKTPLVNQFLTDGVKLGIVAPKGVGKTFLLKCKRTLSNNKGVFSIPTFGGLVDNFVNVTIDHKLKSNFYTFHNWEKLWSIVIFLSIAKNYPKFRVVYENPKADLIIERLMNSESLALAKHSPSSILLHIVRTFDYKDLISLLESSSLYLSQLRQIEEGVHVYIDKVEQAFSEELHSYDLEKSINLWKFAQLGLCRAAIGIYNVNQHLKVYFSMRIEAMQDLEGVDDRIRQSKGMLTFLKYSKDELRELFYKYIDLMEPNEVVKISDDYGERIVGFSVLPHSYVEDENESIFDYIYRHTLYTPRDMMIIGEALTEKKEEMSRIKNNYTLFREIVNGQGKDIIEGYFDELVRLRSTNSCERELFLKVINYNIFDKKYMEIAFKKYIALSIKHNKICEKDKTAEENPWIVLRKFLNLGLIGVAKKYNNKEVYQKFESLQDGADSIKEIPSQRWFFLHPCMSNLAIKLHENNGGKFTVNHHIIIGKDYSFDGITDNILGSKMYREKKKLNKVKVLISSTCYNFETIRQNLYDNLSELNYEVYMSDLTQEKFRIDDVHSHDACLEVVHEVDHVIFIQGNRFGGKYIFNGRYTHIRDQIIDKVPNLRNVSISMMEHMIANNESIPIYSFVHEKLDFEFQLIKENDFKDIKLVYADSNDAVMVVGYLRSFKENNWYTMFSDEKTVVTDITKQLEYRYNKQRTGS